MNSDWKIFRIEKNEDLLAICPYIDENAICAVDTERIEQFAKKRKLHYEIIDIKNLVVDKVEINHVNRNDALIILMSQDHEMENVAQYYAIMTRRDMIKMSVSEFESFIGNENNFHKEILVISDCEHLEQIENVVSMNSYILNMGIVWGNGGDDLLYKLNKIILCANEKCERMVVVDRTDRKTEKKCSVGTIRFYVPHADSSKESMEEAISEKAEVLAFAGHGRDELLWLSQGVLCPGPKNIISNRTPNCNGCGECFKPNMGILKIGDVNVTNCFVQACTSGNLTRPVFGKEYSVLNSFLDNCAVSYIGTPYLCNEFYSLVHYYSAQMAIGRPVGEITQRINNYYFNYGVGNKNEFFLVGDPHHRVGKKYEEKRVVLKSDEKEIEVMLEEETAMLILETDSVSLDEFFSLEKEVVIRNEKRQEIYSHIYRSDDNKKSIIEVFTNGVLAPGIYTINIKKRRAVNLMGLPQIEYIYELGIVDQNAKRFFDESLKVAKNFCVTLNTLLAENSSIGNHIYSKYDKLVSRIDQIDKQINNVLWNKAHKNGVIFDELCLGEGFKNLSKQISSRRCPYCKGNVTEKHIINKLSRIRRVHSFCNTCGVIEDRPLETSIKAEFAPIAHDFKKDAKNNVTLSIKNIGERDVHGVVSIAVVSGEKNDFTYLPREEKIELKKGETKDVSFIIDQGESVPKHGFWLTAILTFETEIQIVKRDIFYGE